MLQATWTYRAPHCVGLPVTQQMTLLVTLTLRGPSGGHCVELEGVGAGDYGG